MRAMDKIIFFFSIFVLIATVLIYFYPVTLWLFISFIVGFVCAVLFIIYLPFTSHKHMWW